MQSKNVAYSKEYLDHRREFDSVFESPGRLEKSGILGNGKYSVDVFQHTQRKFIQKYGAEGDQSVIALRVKDRENNTVAEIKAIDDHDFITLIEHRNGREYLIYRIDLYGYSVMDIASGMSVDYIPESSFMGEEETFIWVGIEYCPVNDLLVADGCYWACPWGFEFYDFSNPMELPLPLYGNSFALEEQMKLEFEPGAEYVRFTDSGECVLKIDGSMKTCTIDIVGKSKRSGNKTDST